VGPWTQWRGQSDTADRRMRWLVLISLLLHTPLTPLLALFGLFTWLSTPPDEGPEPPPLTAIPVDLIEEDELGTPPGGAEPPPPVAVEPEAVLPPPEPKKEPKGQLVLDAGVPDASEPDAEPRDAGPDDADARAELADASDASDLLDASDAESDAGAADAGPGFGDGGGEPVAAVSGDARKVIDSNANVRVLIYPEKIRTHKLAPRIGRLLGSIYQWRDFFGPAGIDPIRDVDRVLITGSQLRNSKDVAAILKLNVSSERIHGAIDAIVRADTEHGEWLPDAGLPAATAYADRAPRVFVIGTGGIVIVTPPSALDNVLAQGKKLGLKPSAGPEVVTAYAVTPHRVRGLPVRVPESIRWVKIGVIPDAQGGALLHVTAEDETPELAQDHAEELERGLTAAATLDLGILGDFLGMGRKRLVQNIELRAEGNKIHGSAVISAAQLDEILGFAEAFLVDRRRPSARPPSSGIPAPSAAPGLTPPAGTGSRRSPRR
ncbi:MAG TPA: hypothetical protein VGK73_21340, partial [Polyangiaceae bacterium]